MDNKEEKSLLRAVFIPLGVIAGATIIFVIAIVAIWARFLLTMPKLDKQLQFSPFYQTGEWKCEEANFVINSAYSTEEGFEASIEVRGYMISEDEEIYNFDISYISTRGFNHKYAATIYLTCDTPYIRYNCYYDFKENEFTLKNIDYYHGVDVFDGKTELHFIKIA